MKPAKFSKVFGVTTLLTSPLLILSCTPEPGTVEAINSASASCRNIIGIEISNLIDNQRLSTIYKGKGVYVSAVIPRHPASLAGVKAGDIIMSIDSIPVNGVSEAMMVINNLEGGRKYPFRIYRMAEKPDPRFHIANAIVFTANILIEKVQERAIGRIS